MTSRKKDPDALELLDQCYNFGKEVIKEVPNIVSVVLFGSLVRRIIHKKEIEINDIDLLIIVDDINMVIDENFVSSYREKINEIAKRYNNLHITTTRLTKFWKSVMSCDPVIISIVREGMPLYDSKIFTMFKKLLFDGFIKPTPESVANTFNRARLGLDKSENKAISTLIDLYWALVDALQSLLLYYNITSVAPENLREELEELRRRNKDFPLSSKDIAFFNELYDLTKRVMHRQKRKVEFYLLEEVENKVKDIIHKLEEFYGL